MSAMSRDELLAKIAEAPEVAIGMMKEIGLNPEHCDDPEAAVTPEALLEFLQEVPGNWVEEKFSPEFARGVQSLYRDLLE